MRKVIFVFLLIGTLIGCDKLNNRLSIYDIAEKYEEGKFEEAKSDMLVFLEKNKNSELGWTVLGHIYIELDDDEKALESYNKALEIDPKMEEALTGAGIVARRNEEYQKAAEYYYRAIENNPKYAQAYSSLVAIHLQQNEYQKAVDVGLRGYKLEKTDPIISSNLSLAYHYNGDTIQRDKFYKIAEKNGYPNLESLQMLFNGELSLFD